MVEIGGRAVGTESFRIRRSGFGENAQVIAQGSLVLTREGGKQTVQSALGTVGVGMSLDAYQVKVSGSGELQVRLQRRGDRLVAETTSEAGVAFGYVLNQMKLGIAGDPRSEALVAAAYACL